MNQAGWNTFLELCLSMKNKESAEEFFQFFLTYDERASLARRVLIVRDLLRDEKTQRQISSDLNVSIAKITRGSNELKRTDEKFLQFLKQRLGMSDI